MQQDLVYNTLDLGCGWNQNFLVKKIGAQELKPLEYDIQIDEGALRFCCLFETCSKMSFVLLSYHQTRRIVSEKRKLKFTCKFTYKAKLIWLISDD